MSSGLGRSIAVASFAAAFGLAVTLPRVAASAETPTEPALDRVAAGEPKDGEPCCERTWCVEREKDCEKTCDRSFKAGSRKWTACHDYCAKEVHRCGSCCNTHHAPKCDLYCWGR